MSNSPRQNRWLIAHPVYFAVVVVLALCAVFGCGPGEPIRIGFVGGTSGRVADLGIDGRDAVILAVDQRNQAGGIAGRKVELLVRDDQQDAEQARRVVGELIGERVVAIVGPMTSAMAMAVVPLANEARVVLVSPTASTDQLANQDDHFFRVNASTQQNAIRVAAFHLRRSAFRRLAVVYDLHNRSYSESWLASFQSAYLAGGGEIVRTLGFASGEDVALLQVARDLLAARAEGVLIVANSMDTALFCQQIRKLDKEVPLITSEWAATERLIELGGNAVEGLLLAQNFDRNSSAPAYQAFRQAFQQRFRREPGFAGVIAFDAATIVLEALARSNAGRQVKQSLLAMRRFDGLQEPLVFNEFGDMTRRLYMTAVRDGQFVVVD